jgi:hypothetical protein
MLLTNVISFTMAEAKNERSWGMVLIRESSEFVGFFYS